MIAGSVRVRYKDRRSPYRRYVEQGAGTRPHHHHVGCGQRVPDLFFILDDLVPRVIGREVIKIPLTGDLDDRVRRCNPESLDGREVQLERAAASTKDQDDRRLESESVQSLLPRHPEEPLSSRHPDRNGISHVTSSFRESHEGPLREPAREAVNPAGDGVLLVKESRDFKRVRREDSRGTRVATDAEHHAGAIFFQYGAAAPQGLEEKDACASASRGSAREPGERQGVQLVARARYAEGLDTPG